MEDSKFNQAYYRRHRRNVRKLNITLNIILYRDNKINRAVFIFRKEEFLINIIHVLFSSHVIIHVPYKVKTVHHTHTITKHIHHGGGGEDKYEVLGYTVGHPINLGGHGGGGGGGFGGGGHDFGSGGHDFSGGGDHLELSHGGSFGDGGGFGGGDWSGH